MKILDRINPMNTVSFCRPIAHALGLSEALIFSALISKQEYYSSHGMLDGSGWFYSTVADMQESTTLTKRQQSTAIKALISAGLIECRKCGMPARRYFRVRDDAECLNALMETGEAVMAELNPIAQKRGNVPACEDITARQEAAECSDKSEQNEPYTINPKRNKSKENNPYPSIVPDEKDMTGTSKREEYREVIRENIDYDCFADRTQVDELVEIMLDVVCSRKSTVRVNGEDIPKNMVESRFLKLTHEHIEYVLTALGKNTSAVRNIRAYLITALYNAPATIDSFYTALVNHDMFGKRGCPE